MTRTMIVTLRVLTDEPVVNLQNAGVWNEAIQRKVTFIRNIEVTHAQCHPADLQRGQPAGAGARLAQPEYRARGPN